MRTSSNGFTLVVVLWIVGLIAAMAAAFDVATRTSVQVASNLSENAKAEALADAGSELAFLDIIQSAADPSRTPRFGQNGSRVSCAIAGRGTLHVAVRDAAGLIDLNQAGEPLLEALFAGLGWSTDATRLAAAVFDYRDRDSEQRPGGAEAAAYKAAHLNWLPKNSAFDSTSELSRVLGFDNRLIAAAAPYVTVQSGQANVDPNFADPRLLEILQRGIEGRSFALKAFPEMDNRYGVPRIFLGASQRRVFSILSVAEVLGGARFVRTAIVNLGSRRFPKLTVVEWSRRSYLLPEPVSVAREAC